MLDRRGWDRGSITADVDGLVAAVSVFSTAPLVLVSPEVGLSVLPATPVGRRFADEEGTLNQRLAAACERVVLVVAGQPLWIKPAGAGAPG
jgi:adenosylcobinamide kinase/adenosylcobinamide-phosphate guanylyltransferase